MIETSIFGGRILPTLQPYPTIHPASPHTAWRTGDAIHTFVVTYRTYRAVFDCPWFDCGFINSHGCYPSHLATLTYLTFQLDAHLPLAGEWCGHAWNTASKSLPIWTNFAASNPNGSHVAWEMLPVSVNLQKNTQTLLGGAVVCGCIYLCIFIYIYIHIWFRTYGGSNPMVVPIFPAELHHPSAESVFDSPNIIQGHPVVPTTGCLFQFTQTFHYVAWRFIIHYLWPFPPFIWGFPKSWGYQVIQVFTILKNMSSSVRMMTFPTEWKNNPNVPNHQPVFDWNNHGDGDPPWLEVPWYFLTRDLHGWSPFFGVSI